jgi:tetratricopeptide (TPR) repeat protein
VTSALNNLGRVYWNQGNYGEADGFARRALAIHEKALGQDHPDVAETLNSLAVVYASAGNNENALAYSRRATRVVIAHAETEISNTHNEKSGGLVAQRAYYFRLHVANLAAAAQKGLEPAPQVGREGLEMAQWAIQSSAAAALQQIGVRFGSGGGALAALVRERQDLAALWRDQNKKFIEALGKCRGQKNQAAIERLRKEMTDTESRIANVAARLEKNFPEYAALANPQPLQAEEVSGS